MNTRILLLAISVAALSSCSSVYKTGQTPDDVYFSPAKERDTYVRVERDEDRYTPQGYAEYQDAYRNDRFLRLSIRNRYYMNSYNDYGWNDWRYNSYAYNWNSPWNSYYSWNSYYNPYCTPVYYYYPKGNYGSGGHINPSYTYNRTRPASFNYRSYNRDIRSAGTPLRNGTRSTYYNSGSNNGSRYNNSNSFGNAVRHTFGTSNSNGSSGSSNSSSTPSRSYSPSSSSGSSSSGSSSGSGGGGGSTSRPSRGG